MHHVIVTGLPRSGLTLASALLDGLPDSVCLHSPEAHSRYVQHCPDALFYAKLIAGDFIATRAELLAQKPIADHRAPDGQALTDGMDRAAQKATSFNRSGLTPAFTLGMRHHALYTSVLPALARLRHFTIIAVIRHPLTLFASWKKLPQPIITANHPSGIARFWPEVLHIAAQHDPVVSYVQLYDCFLQRYDELRSSIHIIKYEDMVDDPMRLSRLMGTSEPSANTAKVQARRPIMFSTVENDRFREAIRRYGVFSKLYYPD